MIFTYISIKAMVNITLVFLSVSIYHNFLLKIIFLYFIALLANSLISWRALVT